MEQEIAAKIAQLRADGWGSEINETVEGLLLDLAKKIDQLAAGIDFLGNHARLGPPNE